MATYIELVNAAILESGTDLDPLLSIDFDDPDDKMYVRFKNWVAQSWKEIQMERNEWEFQTEQYQTIIKPRLHIIQGNRATAPGAGAEFEGDDTEASFTLSGTPILLSGAWADGDAEAWIEYEDLSGQFKFNELYDELSPTPANLDVFRLKWWGRYDLMGEVDAVLEPQLETFYIQSTGGSTTQTNSSYFDNRKLYYVPWNVWIISKEEDGSSVSRPTHFTTTPEGFYDFWPRLDQEYVLTFQGTRTPQILSVEGDTPSGLRSEYHDIIYWRAIMKWANFSQRSDVFARAEHEHNRWKVRLERNEMPPIGYAPSRYDLYRY